MTKPAANGAPMLRTRGLVLKACGPVFICPKCKGDVPATAEVMETLGKASVLFFRRIGAAS